MDTESHTFEPDAVLASEFGTPRTHLPEPERALMIAVLEEASRCLLNYCAAPDRKRRALSEEARDWFASTEQAHLYAYENVCHVLGIDPDFLRRRIFAVRERRRAASAEARRAAAPSGRDRSRAAGE
ncbi:MAG: hypothetical protein IT294_15130 [Deltaproteobacteria bacterium]|nr:hypothetical protein [Deltaproteobacteria bacterium]